jgi:hypothetical protein
MSNRKNTFLLKRSSVPNKIPLIENLSIGELALNTHDGRLYTLNNTGNQIFEIGWDKVNRSGDTMTGALNLPFLSASTINSTEYLNLPIPTLQQVTDSGNVVDTDATGYWEIETQNGYSKFRIQDDSVTQIIGELPPLSDPFSTKTIFEVGSNLVTVAKYKDNILDFSLRTPDDEVGNTVFASRNWVNTNTNLQKVLNNGSVASGNTITLTDVNFINTKALSLFSFALGSSALISVTGGTGNIGIGHQAAEFHRSSTTGSNLFFGFRSGRNLINGNFNIGIGTQSLESNTAQLGVFTGNTAIGFNAIRHIGGSASNNIAIGNETLGGRPSVSTLRMTGVRNVAVGDTALGNFQNGDRNNAIGNSSLFALITGDNNTANGGRSLINLTNGDNNTWFGAQPSASLTLTSGSNNTVIGIPTYTTAERTESNNIIIADGQGNRALDINVVNGKYRIALPPVDNTYTQLIGMDSSGNYRRLDRSIVSGTTFTGGTVTGPTDFTNGLTATTISATTYLGLPLDIKVTGATKTDSVATFTNNTGGTFTLTGLTDTFIDTIEFEENNYDLKFSRNDGVDFVVSLALLSSDVNVTGGTYNINTGVVTFTNNSGNTFNVSGFTSGMTDTIVTGGTYNNNSGVATFINSTGGTFSVSGFTTPFTGGTVNELTATTISATTYLGLPQNISGTTNFIPKFTGTTLLGNSQIFDDGTNVGVGTLTPTEKLHVNGKLRVDTIDNGVGDFLTRTSSGVITRRTASEVLADIGAQATLTNPVTGLGSANRISFWDSTSGQTFSDNLVWDNANSRLGIGLTAPLVSIHTTGDIHTQGGDRTIFNRSNNALTLGTNNTERLRLTNNGDLIFGAPAVTPLARVHLRTNSALSTTNAFRLENSSPLPLLEISNTGRFILDGGLVRIEDFGDVKIQQNVGIGFSDTTTTPICRLDVRNNIPGSVVHRVSGTDGTLFQVVDDLSDNVLEANDISGINLFAVHSSGYSKHLSNREWGLTDGINLFTFHTSIAETFKVMYSVKDGVNLRGGEYICVQSGTDINTVHNFPTEFGDTSGISFNFGVEDDEVIIRVIITSGSWDVKLNVSML